MESVDRLETLLRWLEAGETLDAYPDESGPSHYFVDEKQLASLLEGVPEPAWSQLARLRQSSQVFRQYGRLALPIDLTKAIINLGRGQALTEREHDAFVRWPYPCLSQEQERLYY